MFRFKPAALMGLVLVIFLSALNPVAAQRVTAPAKAATEAKLWSDLGRAATPDEVKAWDIDVRPDFKGLPAGSGSVSKGQDVWDDKCASCHGTFGESNEVFTPIVGGTKKEDIQTGKVAALKRTDFPQRTSLMKLSQLSTLWDYINRAMPWNSPKSLSVEEVYAVTAYILHLGDIVPADFVLSDKNIAQTQQLLPNRNGKIAFAAGMWRARQGGSDSRPDVQGDNCMRNCKVSNELRSRLPDYARDAHGNLAEQQRSVGPMRGAVTVRTLAAAAGAMPGTAAKSDAEEPSAEALAKQANCMACHGLANRLVGPSFKEVASRYKDDAKATGLLASKIKAGGQGVWGAIPMPASPQLKDQEIQALVTWILSVQ